YQYDRHETADPILESRRFDQRHAFQDREIRGEISEESIRDEYRCFRADTRAGGNKAAAHTGERESGDVARGSRDIRLYLGRATGVSGQKRSGIFIETTGADQI